MYGYPFIRVMKIYKWVNERDQSRPREKIRHIHHFEDACLVQYNLIFRGYQTGRHLKSTTPSTVLPSCGRYKIYLILFNIFESWRLLFFAVPFCWWFLGSIFASSTLFEIGNSFSCFFPIILSCAYYYYYLLLLFSLHWN